MMDVLLSEVEEDVKESWGGERLGWSYLHVSPRIEIEIEGSNLRRIERELLMSARVLDFDDYLMFG
jgi:hypothetical protein